MPDTDADIQKVIDAKSSLAHKELANRLHALSLAGAFGSLFYLMSLEQLLPPATSEAPWALRTAWYFVYLSCVFGSIHLWLEMMLPVHARNMAVEAARDFPTLGEAGVRAQAERKTKRFLMWGIPLFGHVVFLIGVFVFSAIYRFSN
jgi:hypothetical protein